MVKFLCLFCLIFSQLSFAQDDDFVDPALRRLIEQGRNVPNSREGEEVEEEDQTSVGSPIDQDGGIFTDYSVGGVVSAEYVRNSNGEVTHLRLGLGTMSHGSVIILGSINNNECEVSPNEVDDEGNPVGHCEDDFFKHHHIYFEAGYFAGIAGGVDLNLEEGTQSPLFRLKVIGQVRLAANFWQLVPLGIGLDNIEIDVENGESNGAMLLGGTVMIPISLLAGMKNVHLIMGATLGSRMNTRANDDAFAINPFIRYIHQSLNDQNHFLSVDANGLFTVDSNIREYKSRLHITYGNLGFEGSRIGVLGQYTDLEDTSIPNSRMQIPEFYFTFGGNF